MLSTATARVALSASSCLKLFESVALHPSLAALGHLAVFAPNTVISVASKPAVQVLQHNCREFSAGPVTLDLSFHRQRLHFSDLQWTRDLLPHRHNLVPHFTAHSVFLLPSARPVVEAQPESSVGDQIHFTPHGIHIGSYVEPPVNVNIAPLQADSVKRKRRLKMKKHKHRKRLKKMRHQN